MYFAIQRRHSFILAILYENVTQKCLCLGNRPSNITDRRAVEFGYLFFARLKKQ